jgi:hypothetical protein
MKTKWSPRPLTLSFYNLFVTPCYNFKIIPGQLKLQDFFSLQTYMDIRLLSTHPQYSLTKFSY